MAAPLTWRNVDTPDFRGSMDGYRIAGQSFERAFGGLSQGLEKFDENRRTMANDALALASTKYTDPAALRAAMADGSLYQGINQSLVGSAAIGNIDTRANSLLREAIGTEALNHDRLNNPEVRRGVILGNEGKVIKNEHDVLMNPLLREGQVAQTASSRASAASSMASAASTGQLMRQRAALHPGAMTAQDIAIRTARGNLDYQTEARPIQLESARAGLETERARMQALLYPELAGGAPAAGGSSGSRPAGGGSAGAANGAGGEDLPSNATPGGRTARAMHMAASQAAGPGTGITGYDAATTAAMSPVDAAARLKKAYPDWSDASIQSALRSYIDNTGTAGPNGTRVGAANYGQAALALENSRQSNSWLLRTFGGVQNRAGGSMVADFEDAHRSGTLSTAAGAREEMIEEARRVQAAEQAATAARRGLARINANPNTPPEIRARYEAIVNEREATASQLIERAQNTPGLNARVGNQDANVPASLDNSAPDVSTVGPRSREPRAATYDSASLSDRRRIMNEAVTRAKQEGASLESIAGELGIPVARLRAEVSMRR